jgi:hypothetical protein
MTARARPERPLFAAPRPKARRPRGQGRAGVALAALFGVLSGDVRLASAQPAPVEATPPSVAAEPTLPIVVERDTGAEDCPDTGELSERIRVILGHGTDQEVTRYRVTFSRGPQGFTAAIHPDTDGAVARHLHAHEPTCAALAHATAVALAVLFDSDLASTLAEAAVTDPPEAVAPPAKPPSPALPVTPLESRDATHGTRVTPTLAVGVAALVGVLRPIAPALLADAGIQLGRFRTSVGALWVTPQTLALPPGSARENLLAGTLRVCYVVSRGRVFRFDACSGGLIGAASAEARGFKVNEQRTELFLAFPLEMAVAARTGIFSWELGASALILAPPNEFQVTGRGATYQPSPLAGMFALRVVYEPL